MTRAANWTAMRSHQIETSVPVKHIKVMQRRPVPLLLSPTGIERDVTPGPPSLMRFVLPAIYSPVFTYGRKVFTPHVGAATWRVFVLQSNKAMPSGSLECYNKVGHLACDNLSKT